MIECCHRDWEWLDMGSERKLFLLVVSFVFVLVLLNAGSATKPITEANNRLASGQTTHYYTSDGISQFGTTIQLAGTEGLHGWYTSNVTVTLSVQSSVSGVTTAYSYDNAVWHSYTGPFNISTEGSTTLYYNSTDPSGIVEDTKMTTIQIDKTPPDLTLETQIVPGKGVNVTITATDKVSTVTDTGYGLKEGKWTRYSGPVLLTEEGTQPFYYRAIDEAGNLVEKLDYIEVVILPAVAETELSYTGDTMGVYSDPVILEASLTNSLTGSPVVGKSIEFTVGTQTATAVTDKKGLASATLILNLQVPILCLPPLLVMMNISPPLTVLSFCSLRSIPLSSTVD